MLESKDYCDYKLVLELKELGYDYIRREGLIHLYDAQKWLREEKGIHINIHYVYHLNEHVFVVTLRFIGKTLREHGVLYESSKYPTYEEALLEGIKEAVKILKEK